ncbi:XRE family transcriptional regulator [Lysinibacillus capsici]|uniref:LexA family protein n=1 Tax=Lysinibacillus capsici TaxID=2115968 RepID=UPI00272FC9BA|nr:XRE family transcriptional regulator [Lysinibacillus capsici]MDP1395253.1 XRE family transcriptional regulator [Lysinibacillus capsici]MDP1415719.1 XRE family transcriptional regulator [Lysinibacillus capsici]MDP1431602.1 XRE family transcriptional regulator [Lysinibacillus capsici]
MNLGDRIKKARLDRGLTLLEVAERLGKTEATIQRYESGNIKNLKNDTIEDLASVLNVSPAYLMGWDTDFIPTNIISLSPTTVKIPVLGKIACGNPITAEENLIGYRYESPDLLPNGKLIYLQAKGDSMEPTIPNGSYVLIREQPDVENGEIAAVLVNGDTEATLKRVKKQGDTVFLMPDNPRHEPYVITSDNPARIIGKAIRFTQEL